MTDQKIQFGTKKFSETKAIMSDKVREARQKKYAAFVEKVKALAGLTEGKEYDAGNLHLAAMQDLEGFCNKVRGAEEALMSAQVIWGRTTLDDGSRGLPVVDGESVDRLRELVVDMLEWPAWKTRQEAEGMGDLVGIARMEMAWNPATDQRSQVVTAEAAGTPLWDRALVHPWVVRHYMRVGDQLELRDVTSLAVAFSGALPQHTRDRISAKSPAEIALDDQLRVSHAARAEADAEAKRKAKEAEAKRKAEEAEAKAREEAAARPFLEKLAALRAELEAEAQRKAEAEAEAKRRAEAEEAAKRKAMWLAEQPPQVAAAKAVWNDLREEVAQERAAFVSLLETGEGLEAHMEGVTTLEGRLEVYSQLASIAASLARYTTAEEKLSRLAEMENLPWFLRNIPPLLGEWKDPTSQEEWEEFQAENQFAFGRIRFVVQVEDVVEEEPKPKAKSRKKSTAIKGSDEDLKEMAAEEEEEKPKARRRSSKG